MQNVSNRPWRLYSVAALFILLWLIVLGRLFYVQVIQGKNYAAKAVQQQSRKFEIASTRGNIYVQDSNGLYPVALNNQVYTLAVDPKFVKNKQQTIEKISQITLISEGEVAEKLNREGRYVEISKVVNTDQADLLKKESLPGVILQPRSSRYYPEGGLFSHVLGYINNDGEGQYGFEQFANDDLKGQNGQYNTVTDALGVPINSTENTLVEPKDGKSYVLTIDRGLQAVAAEAIANAVSANRAESGSIIIMEPKTGAIKALVNYPDYDPNNFSKIQDYSVFTNRAVSELFEPGSGFKVITMATGLDLQKVKPDTKYNDTGEVEVSGKTIRNAENEKFGIQTMTDVIQKSLNTGVVFVLNQLGTDPNKITLTSKETLHDYIEKFGFGRVTGIEQAGEVSSKVKPTTSSDIDYANMSFGQGISVNSIQLLAAVGAIANKGTLVKPHLVAGEARNEQLVNPVKTETVRQVISPQAASDITQMMTQVVEHGSGYLTRMKGYSIAGKTGTAQVPRQDGKGYEEDKNIGSFVGFAPADDPQFVMFVRVDYPKVSGFAEKTAVPAFAVVAKELFKYYKIPPSGN